MNMPSPRRFPPPWTIEELNDACFIVSDSRWREAGICLFRGRAWAAISSEVADEG